MGVKGVLDFGESSGRPNRRVLLSLPDRSRLSDSCLFNGEGDEVWPGIMRGGRSLGDGSGRDPGDTFDSVFSAVFW